jgi:hypothetical protein
VVEDVTWANAHIGVAIISACLPTYQPLVSGSYKSIKSYYSSVTGSSTSHPSKASNKFSDNEYGSPKRDAFKAWQSVESRENVDGDAVNLVDIQSPTRTWNAQTV